jgi:hypothetical protein
LTAQKRKSNVDDVVASDTLGRAPSAPAALGAEAARAFLRHLLANQVAESPLSAIAVIQGAAQGVEESLHAAVDRARDAGHSWAELGQILGTSRQAAFQRFGRPADPRTGAPMTGARLADADQRGLTLFSDLVAGRWEAVCRTFGEQVAARVNAAGLAAIWAQLAGIVGRFERMGAPMAYQAGDYTLVDVALAFEAGDRVGRVSYDRRGKVAGLFFLPPGLV